AEWIHDELGEQTPWHVTRFHPSYRIANLPATPLATLEHAYDIGHKVGLKFVYLGNVPGHVSETTACYSCGKPVVERFGYQARVTGLNGFCCQFCGADLNFRVGKGGQND
ncbi:MAG: AmmeMemoRadiSam system radical SAM enzyme, partial [Chloroflexi bacterium]|nr:AmmeMemoRadiSam system radical SAM enzyme [Chloroflexota bacterium]